MSSDDLKSLMSELNNELKQEKEAGMSAKEKQLTDIARRLLQLERDLSVPGSASSDSHRQVRILEMLEGEDF